MKIAAPELTCDRDDSGSHGAIFLRALRPGEPCFPIEPQRESHPDANLTGCAAFVRLELLMTSVETFFQTFEQASAVADVETLARLFAPSFLVAGVGGAQPVKTSDFLAAIPKRKQMFQAAGCKPAALVSLHEIKLDDRYALIRTEWRWAMDRPDVPEIRASSTFLLQRTGDELRIVLYVSHEDVMALLRERGLLPRIE